MQHVQQACRRQLLAGLGQPADEGSHPLSHALLALPVSMSPSATRPLPYQMARA
jgi:hypothetical protein